MFLGQARGTYSEVSNHGKELFLPFQGKYPEL